MNKKIVIYTQNHPLANHINLLQENGYTVIRLDSPKLNDQLKIHQTVFDLCCLKTSDKKTLLKALNHHKVYSDLSVNNVKSLLDQFPQITGAFSLSIYGNTSSRECFINEDDQKEFEDFLTFFQLSPFYHEQVPNYFILGRTIAPIINEAYFAIEEDLASKEDIDKAMKYGVNYPLGPFEWVNLFGTDKLSILLNELYSDTKLDRYIPCTLLS
ncbi:MAG: 3-hydroxyacyl-CoA dehydrogenase family protein [Bdellovibrionales bacterium]|jgi:3-hydroxybutyryl-CoA dehydrogenase|nr:3-hydroxyacyl-CoA dehydrogenase family protein [Bdellovibrionales bacterium]